MTAYKHKEGDNKMSWSKLQTGSVAVLSLAITVLVGLAVVTSIKGTGLIDNTTAGYFTDGITYFGLFVGIIVLGLIAAVLINMFGKKRGM